MAQQYLGQRPAAGDQVMASFDGHAEILLENWGILSHLRDPYYQEVVELSEAKLTDKASDVVRRVGYEEVWVSDGKAAN
ncbi:hypothetical protein ABZX51_005466 [Aspergillus tubingensis]